jgi:hypothetical protein
MSRRSTQKGHAVAAAKSIEIPPEQLELLRWACSLGAITAPALALRLGISAGAARARLATARRSGLLEGGRVLADGPALFTATRAGIRVADVRGIEQCKVNASSARHLAACALAAAALEHCYPDRVVIGERELRRAERERGAPIASARIRRGEEWRDQLHRPDLVLIPRCGSEGALPVAVEMELTIKAPRRLQEICRAWARSRLVEGVIYLAPPDVQRALARALQAAQASEQIAVVPLSALPGYQAA